MAGTLTLLFSRGGRVFEALRRPDVPALRQRDHFTSPRSLRRFRFPTIVLRMAAYGSGGGDCHQDEEGDITAWFVDGSTDAIVNAANERMLGGGGVDGAIHRAAGPELLAACRQVPEVRPGVRCPTGQARITPAFRLPASRVIHTVGPIYDTDSQPKVSLRSAYRSCLSLAKENGIQYIAFPAISCGVYGYPYKEASQISISEVKNFSNDFREVHFVLFSDEIHKTWIETAHELLP
ncbi:unnamed protein product [Spirodela intermedia]|uniref:Macro domain-containing protein n=1 Tax=Spirodela intermedia TaxID=51605 RepID=A0A7I8IAL6_SPIIN|nr:unnamed protein product [Spirodela intermedia]CAA6654630.1 unnamed protein product [Spirodela intermedia]